MATIGNFTLKFNTDVSMAGTLREAVARDKAAVEQIRDEIEASQVEIGADLTEVRQKHADVVLKHGEVEADRQEVAASKAAIDAIQSNIDSQQADITAAQWDVTTKAETVNAQAAQVASDAQDVADDKAHVTQTVNHFNTTAADALQAVTDEGNTQNTRLIAQGDTQDDRIITAGNAEVASVTSEGQTQRNLLGTASANEQTAIRNGGTTQVNRVQAEGDTQTARATAEADRAKANAESTQSDRAYVETVTGKFGDVDAAITEATQQADRSTAQATIATDKAAEASTARDEAVAVVYDGEASLTPAPGKIPIARGDGVIEPQWFLGKDTPFNAPLLQNRLLAAGTGDPVMMDVSEAGDGSVMRAVPYLYTMNLQGPEDYDNEGFKFGRGTILSPAPDVLSVGRTVSVNIAALQGEQANSEWTPNYNGVNSCVEIPEWKPAGEFECDLTTIVKASTFSFIMGNTAKDNFFGFKTTGQGVYCSSNMQFVVSPSETGFSKAKLTGNSGCSLNEIGCRGKRDFFKGQISNLKLIDKENPENSRFYPGVIYSYVDPDATEVPVPDSTMLVDEWCVGEDALHTPDSVTNWSKSGDVWTRTNTDTWSSLNITGTHPAGTVFEVEVREVSNDVYLFTPRAEGGNRGIKMPPNKPVFVKLEKDSHIWFDKSGGTIRIAGIKVTKVTHGTMTNFGTDQPYVPLLGDREEYCGTYNSRYIRGVAKVNGSLTALAKTGTTVVGSFVGSPNKLPLGSMVVANGISKRIVTIQHPAKAYCCNFEPL